MRECIPVYEWRFYLYEEIYKNKIREYLGFDMYSWATKGWDFVSIKKNNFVYSSIRKVKRSVLLNWHNSKGWSTEKKYIIFESDDWGSIRTASPGAYQTLIRSGDNTDKDPFTKYDALASENDLKLLFEVLSEFRDYKGKHPVITANCAVANPDFDRIRESNFEYYYYEPFTETLKRYKTHRNCLKLWKEGIKNGLFFPQLHCREHLHIINWLNDLKNGDKNLRLAFTHNMISGASSFSNNNLFAYMDAFHYYGSKYDRLLEEIISDATTLFYKIFGYESRTFIACCYVWNSSLEKILVNHNIKYIQGSHYQLVPTGRGHGILDKKRHIIGETNKYGQTYLIRNCNFEPSLGGASDAVDLCLAQISNSFKWKRPATINTHRLNYVGYIDKSNRDNNLPLLKQLLIEIIKWWPDVEFITSAELGTIIKDNKKEKQHNMETVFVSKG